ncbi:hypothetical protein [Microvirga alba]|uniref:Uncharacterized protein n=1 Tax=Microvirga alba TaxID=2791025 RepID=A0A931FQ17_9HYPH|nr:hypothetical protein [Microvirga alba]MBF9233018.1 hypothetical protein [Microvirga alba]
MMRTMSLAAALAFFASSVLAQQASTLTMTCEEAAHMVASEGAAVLSTGPGTYDRYVSSLNSCELDQVLEPAWVPTANSAQCPVGYRCRSPGY